MAWLPFQKLFAVSDYVLQSSQHFFNKNAQNFVIKVNKLAVGLFSKLKFELGPYKTTPIEASTC